MNRSNFSIFAVFIRKSGTTSVAVIDKHGGKYRELKIIGVGSDQSEIRLFGKGTLEMRPMFHFTPKRIEAHICICFVAYKVYKELERVIRSTGLGMSVDRVLAIAKTITTLRIRLPNGETLSHTLFTTPQQESIRPLLDALSLENGLG